MNSKISKILKIDSNNATKYYNDFKTSLFYNFDEITTYAHQSIFYSVLNCSIPYSFYAVNKYNQYLDIVEKINNVLTGRTIVIPAGNYSSIDFAKTLKILLNNEHITYEIEYNKINNRYLIKIVQPNVEAIFKFGTGPNSDESCYKLLGMIQDDLIINNEPFLSLNSIIMNDITYLQIRSDLGNNIVSSTNEDNILEVIPINSVPYGYISYNPFQPNKYLLSSKSINSVSLSLLDNNENELNLNGLSFLITIKIDIVNSDDHDIPFSTDPRRQLQEQQQNDEDKSNLQIISENPSIVNTSEPQNPISLSDWIYYQNIKKMIKDNKKKK